jgi:myb proto-oncogene protein
MGIDPVTHEPLEGQKQPQQASPTTTSAHSSTITAESKSMDGQQENKHIDTDKDVTSSGEESSMPESSNMNTTTSMGIANHDQDPLVKWLMEEEEEDLPSGVVDESWIHLTASDNIDELNIITATTPWDIVGVTDWLLDYQDFGIGDSSLPVDVSMVDSSSGSNL